MFLHTFSDGVLKYPVVNLLKEEGTLIFEIFFFYSHSEGNKAGSLHPQNVRNLRAKLFPEILQF